MPLAVRMVRSFALATCSLLLLGTPSRAQGPATARPAASHRAPWVIPPGDLGLRSLVEGAASYLGRPPSMDGESWSAFGTRPPFRLQNPLTLTPANCAGLVSRLALVRGLVLVPDAKGEGRWRWRNDSSRAAIKARPWVLTPAQVLGLATPQVWVETTLKVATFAPEMLVAQLRPWFTVGPDSMELQVAGGDTIKLRGFTDEVAAALRICRITAGQPLFAGGADSVGVTALIVAVNAGSVGAEAEQTPVVVSTGPQAFAAVLDKVAMLLGQNHVFDPAELAAVELQLDQPLTLSPHNALRRFAAVAAEYDVAMLPLAPEHGLYEWVHMRGPRRMSVLRRAMFVSPDAAGKLAAIPLAVVSALRLEHVPPSKVQQLLRAQFSRGEHSVALGAIREETLLLSGLAPAVAAAIAEARQLDRAPPGR